MVNPKVRATAPQEWSSEHPSRERMRVPPEIVASDMILCGECGEVRGRFTDPYDRAERVQACACSVDAPPSQRTPWPRYDINSVVEVCPCCASALVHSGTLSTPLFCDKCLGWVEALNENEGRAVIPEDRQAASDAANVGLLGVLGKMRAYRTAKLQARLTMWRGAVPASGVPVREYVRRVSPPTFEEFRAFVLAVTKV